MKELLRWKLLLFRRSLSGRADRSGYDLAVFLGLIAIALIIIVARSLFGLFDWVGRLGPELAPVLQSTLLATGYLAGLVVCLLVASTAAFSTLYASSDLPLLFAAPLTVRQVFTVKFLEITAAASLPMFLLAVPIAFVYGVTVRASVFFLLLLPLVSLLAVLLPVALGTFLTLLAVRAVPPYRAGELGLVLGALLGAGFHVFVHLGLNYLTALDPGQLVAAARGFALARAGVSPAWWLGCATVAAARGRIAAFLGWSGLVAAVSAVLYGVSFVLVQEAFYGGWAGAREVRLRRRRRRPRRPSRHPSRSPLAALALKETRTFIRDPGEWVQVVRFLVVVLLPFLVRRQAFPWMEAASANVLMVFAYLLAWIPASSLALGSVSREAGSWPVLRSAPVRGREIVAGKILGILPLVAVPGLPLATALPWLLGARGWHLLVAPGFLLLATPGVIACNVYAGSAYPNLAAADTRRRASIAASVLGAVLTLVHAGVLAVAVGLVTGGSWTAPGLLRRLAGIVLLPAANAGAVAMAVGEGGRELDRQEVSPGEG